MARRDEPGEIIAQVPSRHGRLINCAHGAGPVRAMTTCNFQELAEVAGGPVFDLLRGLADDTDKLELTYKFMLV